MHRIRVKEQKHIDYVATQLRHLLLVKKNKIYVQIQVNPPRTLEQNARYWAILQTFSENYTTESGLKFTAEIWHEYFKLKFLPRRALPGGEFASGETKGLTTKEFSEFSEKVEAEIISEFGMPVDLINAHFQNRRDGDDSREKT